MIKIAGQKKIYLSINMLINKYTKIKLEIKYIVINT